MPPRPALLVVSTSRAVHQLARSLFAPLGWRTFVALDGEGARLVALATDVRLAVVDLDCVGSDGPALAGELRRRAPRAVLLSIAVETSATEAASLFDGSLLDPDDCIRSLARLGGRAPSPRRAPPA
jgi:DNA-binding response OmpR family regulator